MSIEYTNKGKKTYYLHQGKTRTGKPRYYFSMKDKGNLVEKIPEGYEIYEHPSNAQVFLRKKQAQFMTDLEIYLINKHLKKIDKPNRYISDIKGKIITIFESNKNSDELKEFFKKLPFGEFRSEACIDEMLDLDTKYTPIIRFILKNEKKRIFIAERFGLRGTIDDWVYVDGPDSLKNLLITYLTD